MKSFQATLAFDNNGFTGNVVTTKDNKSRVIRGRRVGPRPVSSHSGTDLSLGNWGGYSGYIELWLCFRNGIPIVSYRCRTFWENDTKSHLRLHPLHQNRHKWISNSNQLLFGQVFSFMTVLWDELQTISTKFISRLFFIEFARIKNLVYRFSIIVIWEFKLCRNVYTISFWYYISQNTCHLLTH